MKLKTVKLTFGEEILDFVIVHEGTIKNENYALLILKVLYLEMTKSLVDKTVFEKSIFVFELKMVDGKKKYIRSVENGETEGIKQALLVQREANGNSSSTV